MKIFMKDLKPEYNIIDIRDKNSYSISHVFNSINIPMNELLNSPSRFLNKNERYYLYCTSGIRSKKACELLSILGYDVVNVVDGFGK